MGSPAFPEEVAGHYDAALLQQAQDLLQRRNWSIADLAEQIGYSRAALSKYLSRQLHNPESVEASLSAFFVRTDRVPLGAFFAPTDQYAAIFAGCDYAMTYRRIVPIYAQSGIGKTTSMRNFIERSIRQDSQRRGFVWITANPHLSAPQLLKEILLRLSVPPRGCAHEMLTRAIVELMRKQYLIVIDDANLLRYSALEDLRHLHDQAACGVVLAGTKALMERMLSRHGRHGEDLEQLHSRMGWRPVIVPQMKRKDQEKIVKARMPSVTTEALDILCRKGRVPRVIHSLIEQAEWLRRLQPGKSLEDCLQEAEQTVYPAA